MPDNSEKKTVLVSGATGLVGSALCPALRKSGHSVRALSRSNGDVRWDVEKGEIAPAALDGVDAVVHLAGEPIAQRWTDEVKRRILDSRVRSTELLVEEILKRPQGDRPDFICASGTNFYGYRRDERVAEGDESGEGFLSEVCRAWEGAAQPLADNGVRVAFLRTGIVLSAEGGALAKMLPVFRAGLGGRIASGRQRMSWVGLPDLAAMYRRAVEDSRIEGPLNAVAPESVSNREFTEALGKALGRSTVFPLPKFMVTTLFGDMGKETLLGSVDVDPSAFRNAGFRWAAPELMAALEQAIDGNKETDV